jgi:hypothetical protein
MSCQELMDGIKVLVPRIWSILFLVWVMGRPEQPERVSEGFRYKGSVERGVMSGIFGMPFTPTIGKEIFWRGSAYSIKTDFDTSELRKKEICFPNTVPVTHGSADLPVVGAFMIWALSVTLWKHRY